MYCKVIKIEDREKRPPVPFHLRTKVDESTMNTCTKYVSMCPHIEEIGE